MNPINGISQAPLELPNPTTSANPSGLDSTKSFKDFLLNSVEQVNSMQQEADHAVENMFTGGDANPAEVLTAVQKADVAFRMMMQVRNKLVQVYQEIKDIQI